MDIAAHVDNAASERARRASSFGAVSAAYARYRPGYPDAALAWCLEPVAGQGGVRVLDLGAGTGILTGALVRAGAQVVAVEPDPAMLAELRGQLPEVEARAGSAEATGLAAGSVDAVVCGQSMHWFDLDRALPEISRVLRPGGVLAGLWNVEDDRVGWLAGLAGLTGNTATLSVFRKAPEPGSARGVLAEGSEWFAPVVSAEFGNPHTRTADALVGSIATTSQMLVTAEPEREERLGAIRAYLAARPETSAGEFTLPLVTGVVRALRR